MFEYLRGAVVRFARRGSGNPRGFTLIELLVVIAVIGLLVALVLPATRSARPAVRQAQCTNNLKQIMLALHYYKDRYGAFPPAVTTDAKGRPLHSWRTLILPFMEHEALYKTIDLTRAWNHPVNAKAAATAVSTFHCPASEIAKDKTTYLAIVGPNGFLDSTGARRLSEITDPHESTIAVIEAAEENAVPWMAPSDADEAMVMGLVDGRKLDHPGGMNAAFADGTARFLKASTTAAVRRSLLTVAGGEEIPPEF